MADVVSGTVAALGERALVEGYGLVGAVVLPAETESEVLDAWARMPAGVGAVVLTPRAAAVLGPRVSAPGTPMGVVMP